ncbi:MAG: hypothetical protein ABIH41_03670 [Nanoarchaeota archaeon]
MTQPRSLTTTILARLLGLLVFLAVLWIVNTTASIWHDDIAQQTIRFLNENALLIIVMGAIFLIADIFDALRFPLNIPAPIISAAGALLAVTVILNLLETLDSAIGTSIGENAGAARPQIYVGIFLIVLVAGYLTIISRAVRTNKQPEQEKPPTWQDVGTEWRGLIRDTLRKARTRIKGKPKKTSNT